ncbi:hypothetical protein AtNW77_Chr5g0127971 [Arabidopsis thaliana]|uniref:Transmembrane protein n=2 Tax=Arabidopsis TaxID=3701 RepID=A0A8T2DRM5_ARASU|nr:hypothetical protein ISN45_At05g039570 [Arabidopsis thaliana x Arabidopsis arenosa]KAG7612154.1 hypothetical protein ISN44_As05g042040 [Arabidopsis suecica]
MERKTFSSKFIHLLIVFLLLCIFLPRTESALPYHHELLLGRKRMNYYKPNSNTIGTPSSTSNHAPGGHGRRLMSIYRPNGDIFTGPSGSGHGGGRTPAP